MVLIGLIRRHANWERFVASAARCSHRHDAEPIMYTDPLIRNRPTNPTVCWIFREMIRKGNRILADSCPSLCQREAAAVNGLFRLCLCSANRQWSFGFSGDARTEGKGSQQIIMSDFSFTESGPNTVIRKVHF